MINKRPKMYGLSPKMMFDVYTAMRIYISKAQLERAMQHEIVDGGFYDATEEDLDKMLAGVDWDMVYDDYRQATFQNYRDKKHICDNIAIKMVNAIRENGGK